jgi:hypothetical protein
MITGARAVVYDPPEAGLPFIGVVLGRDGEVLIAPLRRTLKLRCFSPRSWLTRVW